MPGKTPSVALVVLNWNNWQDTIECLESLRRLSYSCHRILVVDNGSTDDSEQILRQRFPELEILQAGANRGYAGGNNVGLRRALELEVDYVCLLNNDVVVERDFLTPLVAAMESDRHLGVAGGLQCSFDESHVIQNSGTYFNRYTSLVRTDSAGEVDHGQCDQRKEVDFICGCALLARVEMVRSLGLLDESFFLLGEEAEWCLRAQRAGWRVCYIPGSKIYHKGAATLGSQPALCTYYSLRNRLWLMRRFSSPAQYALFLLLFFFYLCPKMILGRLVKGEAQLLKPLLRALRDGFAPMHPTIPVGSGAAQSLPARE
ncbi:MAG: glycosyltransferase family 2 protein [Terriglobia bacterium]